MRYFKSTVTAAALLLFGAAGCADLDVTNPNDPDRQKALATAGDVESLIAGAYNTWYNGTYHWVNALGWSNASFQSIGTMANAGNLEASGIPRQAIPNDPSYSDYHALVERPWQRSYRALAAVADGIRTLDENPDMAAQLEARETGSERRVRAMGKTAQAVATATLALYYDKAFVIDETVDVTEEQTPVPYTEMAEKAYGYFDEAIALAEGGSFTLPASWMSVPVSNTKLVELLHSYRAIFRASMPRTEDEAVDWNAVLADLDNALTETHVMANEYSTWYNGANLIVGGPNGWGADTYFIIGMADQSGDYQRWLSKPVAERMPWFGANQDDDPFLIITPDERFPQGSTLAEQKANPGENYVIPTPEEWSYDVSDHFTNAGRGTWRWSYYYNPSGYEYWFGLNTDLPHITIEELNLLRAEALYETGDRAGAAAIVNQTRTKYGLSPTTALGTNLSCVPKLPNGECGGLFEMLKWEKRMETRGVGALFVLTWFWDSRRWGDHYRGTPLQWPIPAEDLQVLQMDVYTFGGVGEPEPSASAGSNYAWPGEQ